MSENCGDDGKVDLIIQFFAVLTLKQIHKNHSIEVVSYRLGSWLGSVWLFFSLVAKVHFIFLASIKSIYLSFDINSNSFQRNFHLFCQFLHFIHTFLWPPAEWTYTRDVLLFTFSIAFRFITHFHFIKCHVKNCVDKALSKKFTINMNLLSCRLS